jgi:hypothetical protein
LPTHQYFSCLAATGVHYEIKHAHGNNFAPRELEVWRLGWMILQEIASRSCRCNLRPHPHFLETIRVMILIRLAISIFALMLIGTAFSLNVVQSEQDSASAQSAMVTRQ